jgi:hypothetical protein
MPFAILQKTCNAPLHIPKLRVNTLQILEKPLPITRIVMSLFN